MTFSWPCWPVLLTDTLAGGFRRTVMQIDMKQIVRDEFGETYENDKLQTATSNCLCYFIHQADGLRHKLSFGVNVCVHVMNVSLIISPSLSRGFGLYHTIKYVNG